MSRARPIRIMHVVPSLEIGGTERQVVALTRGLDRRRFDVHLTCLRREGPFLSEIQDQGIPITEHRISNLFGPNSWRRRFALARHLRRERFDIVHSHGFYANLFATPAARFAGVPVVLGSVRDLGDLQWTSRQFQVQRLMCRLCDRVLVNAHAVAQRCIESGFAAERIVVIRNGIDIQRYAQPHQPDWHERNGLPTEAVTVVVMSRLVRAHEVDFKGIHHFVEAAAIVAAHHEDVRFLIVGDGPYRGELEALATRLGIANRVTFMGFRKDIPDVLAHTDILVQPSLTEALSNSVLEAMAAAVPVVATYVGGNPELVEHRRNGLLVPAGDSATLARAIEKLVKFPALRRRMGQAGRRRATELFSIERLIETTQHLYEERLERRQLGIRRSPRPVPPLGDSNAGGA